MAVIIDERYHLLSTKDELVLSNKECNLSGLSPCTQEEADTSLMLYYNHAAEEGHRIAYMRTVDTDVVVLATHFFPQSKFKQLWIGFGTGRKLVQCYTSFPRPQWL